MISQRWMAGGLTVVTLAVFGSVTHKDTPTAAVAAATPATNASSHLPGGTSGGARTYVTLTTPPPADLPTPLPTVPATPAPTDPATATPTAGDTTAYRLVVISDVPAVGTALTAERAPCTAGDFAGCHAAAARLRDAAQTFLTDLSGVIVPSGWEQGDRQLRHGLGLLGSGSRLQIQGIDDLSSAEITSGTLQVTQGDGLISAATANFPS
jgi:hypothetical protein